MPRQTDLHFSFEPASAEVFDVIEFHLWEALSEPFRLEIELSSRNPAVDFAKILDLPTTLTIRRGAVPVRYVHGIVTAFSQGETGFRRTRYRAVVEPLLAQADLRSSWRIFQQKTVPDILSEVVAQQRIIDYQQHQTSTHLVREYCVQANETDITFLQRLAAEEGFLYTFAHEAGKHTLVHTDQIQTLGDIDGNAVQYRPGTGADQTEPALWSFSYHEQVRTARQTQRDYTFTHPRYDQQHISDGRPLDHQQNDYERYDYPGRYKCDDAGKPFTATRLSALRRDARIALVEGDDARLVPGLRFELTGHPRADLNTDWRAVRIEHHGKQHTSQEEESSQTVSGSRYKLKAELVPATTDWKPPSVLKPCIDGPHIAQVVGPPGEEIFCDEWARVKVQFPWDRQGSNDEHSSCWIRVAQNWAGGAWGHMAIPRVGQEVIVDFLDGDPDQPIIIGRTYNALNPPPYGLPDNKTRMTIKSRTHKGSGFNELRFEDELDREEVFIHAQKDQNNHVNNDETTFVGHDRTERVGHDETISIGHDRKEDVGHDETIRIGGNRSVTIDGYKSETIKQAKAETIALAKALTIGAGYQTTVGAAMNTTVGLSQSEQVGIDKSVRVGKKFDVIVGDEFTLTVGKSKLVMRSDGTVLINGVEFDFDASKHMQLTSKIVDIN